MKKYLLLSALLTTAVISNAQKTLPGAKVQTINRPVSMNPAIASQVSQARKTAYAGTFNPAPIVRNIGGINVRSTAVVNGVNADNITNRPVANSAQSTEETALNVPPAAKL